MPDEIVRADLRSRGAVAFAVDASGAAWEAEWRHLAGRVAAEALARLIAGAALAAGFLKDDEQLSLQIKTEGKLRGALVDVDAQGGVRGFTEKKVIPVMDSGPSDVSYAIGSRGTLTAIRSTASAIRYSGTVELAKGDVASDVERYLETSEQRASVVELATDYTDKLVFAGGVLLQAGPDVDRDWFHARRLRRAELGRILLEERDPEKVIARAFEGEAWDVVARRPIRFRCRCSRERVERMIAGLDREELADMIEKDKGAMVTCHFCNDQYEIAEEELKSMLERRGGGGPGGAPAGRGG